MPITPLPARPDEGRCYTAERRVRLGDATPDGRCRLDALAHYLQDVAEDDAAEAGLPDSIGWVLRSTRMVVHRFPRRGEAMALATYCSGMASRWAARTTTVTGDGDGLVQATAVWVAVDVRTGTPARLGGRFAEVYGAAAAGHRASARLVLGPPPPDAVDRARSWPLRASDFDVWGHVNNAVSWVAVEDAADPTRWRPLAAEVEHPDAIGPETRPVLAVAPGEVGADVWLLDAEDGHVLSSARLGPLGRA